MQIQFQTDDNLILGGYQLEALSPKAVVLINPGTATKTTFYKPFAQFLVEQGFHVILWNYRGFCESRSFSLKGEDYSFSDIGKRDIPAAISYAKAQYPDLPLLCVGHSTGGQQIGIAHNCNELKGLVAIAASAGMYQNMPLAYRLKAYFFFFCFTPISQAIFGYVAAKKLKLMENLPGRFTREWGEWCKEESLYFSPKFLGKDIPQEAYKNVSFPIHVVSADDDEISTQKNIENFWKHVSSGQTIHYTRYCSAETETKQIGHFGYFKKAHTKIWHDILEKLNSMLEQ